MNVFKAKLDTRHQNGVIATVTQFDNAVLELQVLTDGVIDEAWEQPQFELIAMKRDNNPVREVEQDRFTILSKEDHKVQIELKEQFLTCRGTVKMQLIIKDGGRESTTIFYLLVGQSLDRDIIESRVDVKVLDDLETYIQTGREVIYDAQAIVTDLKDEMSEFNASSSEKEAERQASELNRASKELNRIDNEETRVTNEHDRVTNEEDRVTNEEERVANEQDRVTNEQNRRLAENTRIAQERARQDAELQRNSIFEENETIRKDGEKKRITNENEREKKFSTWEERETTRLRSEENRIIQEQVRVANEETRQRHEQTRQNQEDYRQRTYTQFNEAEASRVNKELQRQTAEENRVAAEANRQNSYADRENERDRQYAESEKTRNDAFEQNEVNRQSEYTTAERQRVESEELRKSRERERETAESQRATTERERVNAEQKRAADFNREIENIQNTMNQAVSNVNGAIDTANSTMEGIEQRAEECLPVIEQSSNEIERARVDYIGNQHSSIKKANDANVDWLLGEVNTAHYEGQHITALDTLEGRAKSAILSGQTLKNINDYRISVNSNVTIGADGTITINANGEYTEVFLPALEKLPSTKYWVGINVIENTLNGDFNICAPTGSNCIFNYFFSIVQGFVGVKEQVLTTMTDLSSAIYAFRSYLSSTVTEGVIKYKVMAIPYQEGMENWGIPYFTGMQSVKLPGLKACGKNLFDMNRPYDAITDNQATVVQDTNKITVSSANSGIYVNANFILDKDFFAGKTVTGSCLYESDIEDIGTVQISYQDGNGDHHYQWIKTPRTFTFPNNFIGDVMLCVSANNTGTPQSNTVTVKNIQLELGSTATSYEPHKSNILTVNEPVELRGIGEVRDTLDCLTGEVTERIGEIMLDGSEGVWSKHSGLSTDECDVYWTSNGFIPSVGKKMLSDKLGYSNPTTPNTFRINNSGGIFIGVSKGVNINDYLSQNTPKIQYDLSQSIIKTVDLSDNHVYSYKDVTHYDCSSAEGSLVPTLSIDVPTNLPAVVTRQRATIQALEIENAALKNEIVETANSSVSGDLELMSSQFELDFRLFEIEMNLDMPMMTMMKGAKSMAMTVYQQAKTLILAGKYDREDMEYKLGRYKDGKRITQDEYDELIALMNAHDLMI